MYEVCRLMQNQNTMRLFHYIHRVNTMHMSLHIYREWTSVTTDRLLKTYGRHQW